MKNPIGFLTVALTLVSGAAVASPVATTAGSNLTAYNPSGANVNNNTWNNMMNGRSGATSAPTADFGNCNSLILRCASPKCANGGCVSTDIARPIVAGCVAANSACKQYGDTLIDTISAQLVANSVAKSNDAANAAATAAAESAAQQSAQQIQQMQMQMQQMQSQMAAQNAETVAQLQAALDEQKQMAAQREAEAAAANAKLTQQNASGLTAAQEAAAANGVSSDILVRNQISGQIMTEIENAEKQLAKMKAAMDTAFKYAGCDAAGNNCTGPARVKKFKDIASEFFTPYEDAIDTVYDALTLAMTVGVDISDIYMMLNDSCNSWGRYLCAKGQNLTYTTDECKDKSCTAGAIKPLSENGCQLVGLISDKDTIYREWDYDDSNTANGSRVLIGCASSALDNSTFFKGRRKKANIDIEILQRLLQQDAPTSFGVSSASYENSRNAYTDGLKYCAVGRDGLTVLQTAVANRKLPAKGICIKTKELKTPEEISLVSGDDSDSMITKCKIDAEKDRLVSAYPGCDKTDTNCMLNACACTQYGLKWSGTTCECTDKTYSKWNEERHVCVDADNRSQNTSNKIYTYKSSEQQVCENNKGIYENGKCDCSKIEDNKEKTACETLWEKVQND